MLILRGADVNVTVPSYGTPLHIAVSVGFGKEVVELLITRGADVNAKTEYGETPLHQAIQWGQTDTAKMLLAHGAEVNARTKEGQTPLDFAYRRAPALVELLLSVGGQEGRVLRKQNTGP